jgi:hypothetical protein
MPVLTSATLQPLTLSEQLDAMLLGWLERTAEQRAPARPDMRATAATTIADNALAEVKILCERWAMTLEKPAARGLVVLIEGPARVVEGFIEIVSLLRR